MRYFVSFIGSPTYNLSKFLVKIISPLLNYKYSVFNLNEFIEKVKRFCVNMNYSMKRFLLMLLIFLNMFHLSKCYVLFQKKTFIR